MSLKSAFNLLGGIGAGLIKPSGGSPRSEAASQTARSSGGSNPPPPSNDPFDDPRWAMLRDKPPEEWNIAAMYEAYEPASSKHSVIIVAPEYRETASIARRCMSSRNAIRLDLKAHGIDSGYMPMNGDSLICRMRQLACHMFLMTGATHMLFSDGDIECLTPDCVRHMLATGHDVIAGACPFKDTSGRTVHNLWPNQEPLVDEKGCVEVADAGTGFMLISRKALLRLMQANPERLHWCMSTNPKWRGAPLWALFDTGVVGGIYQSEDYMFCHLWQELGEKVYVYAPARFAHWGEYGYQASFEEQYGLTKAAT